MASDSAHTFSFLVAKAYTEGVDTATACSQPSSRGPTEVVPAPLSAKATYTFRYINYSKYLEVSHPDRHHSVTDCGTWLLGLFSRQGLSVALDSLNSEILLPQPLRC